MTDDIDPDVFQRLRDEIVQRDEVLNGIRLVLRREEEFSELSLVGGVRAILRRYHEEREKVQKLEKELQSLVFKKR